MQTLAFAKIVKTEINLIITCVLVIVFALKPGGRISYLGNAQRATLFAIEGVPEEMKT